MQSRTAPRTSQGPSDPWASYSGSGAAAIIQVDEVPTEVMEAECIAVGLPAAGRLALRSEAGERWREVARRCIGMGTSQLTRAQTRRDIEGE